MRSTSFHIVNLGCKVNRVEADSMRAALIAQGAACVQEEAADVVIVNTCTVTGEADKKARKAVRHALSVNPLAEVIVTGCAAALSADVFTEMGERVRVVGKADLERELTAAHTNDALRLGQEFRTRVGIKIQDGCDHACTYCIVHVARGKARSVPVSHVMREARRYFHAGVKEVVLTGIDIGAYEDGGMRLADLVSKLLDEADDACLAGDAPARIRVSSIEPLNVDDALIELLATSQGRLCRHLHLPLQSGSTKVLREMARPYSAEEYEALVERLRERVPEIALSTDVIVGFPGETEADFEETCRLVTRAGFMKLHVFPYSLREGTPAAQRSDQVSADVKRNRAARLRLIGDELACRDLAARKGTTELALVQDKVCLAESYHELQMPHGARTGALVPVIL